MSYVFYVTTNSLELRRAIKREYGERVLTDTSAPSLHTDCTKNGNCHENNISKALRLAVTDIALLSLADVHVISARSGFGVVSSMLRLGPEHSIYRIDQYAPRTTSCDGTPDNMEAVTEEW
eukprot:CAMPEP_0182419220 /NCGR_PEP_ID=MMETSP1167-20130531/3637_1 /TAXON_ID=2988 /ORGANISM="Mallomonas Sp, Strain CCMP3275" /LENGTH=120 /DNA_ID=CAMNT_0024593941 /DNA_START=64 /DNA_END=423 /DNA_ORIENTATION=-